MNRLLFAWKESALRSGLPFRSKAWTLSAYNSPVSIEYPSKKYSTSQPASGSTNPRWLSDTRSRLGACIMFGCQGEEIQQAGRIAKTLATEWKGLSAGAEGFYIQDVRDTQQNTGDSVRRLNAWVEGVRWGDMDSMVSIYIPQMLGGLIADLVQGEVKENYSGISYDVRAIARHCPSNRQREWSDICTPRSFGLIYKRAEIDFLLPLTYPDRVTLCHRLADLPPDGTPMPLIPLRVCMLSHAHQRNAARVCEENVVYDYSSNKRAELQPWMETVIRKAAADEALCQEQWQQRRVEIDGWINELEARTIKSGRAEDKGK